MASIRSTCCWAVHDNSLSSSWSSGQCPLCIKLYGNESLCDDHKQLKTWRLAPAVGNMILQGLVLLTWSADAFGHTCTAQKRLRSRSVSGHA